MRGRRGLAAMRARSLLCVATLGASALLVVSPAHAALAEPTITALDVSTVGHVKGTVTTDAPFVNVYIIGSHALLPVSDGAASFDFETWGMREAVVAAEACQDDSPAYGECSSTSYASFTASDVAPEVTWPADTTVAYGDPLQITVSDPHGGGVLRARFFDASYWLDRNGTTTFTPAGGKGDLEVQRCGANSPLRCVSFEPPLTIPLESRSVSAVLVGPDEAEDELGTISTVSTDVPVKAHTLYPDTPITLRWRPESSMDPDPLRVVTGTTDADGDLPFHITAADFTAKPDGNYLITGEVTLNFEEFGAITGTIVADKLLVVDRAAPGIDAVQLASSHPVFPASTSPDWGSVDATAVLTHGPQAGEEDGYVELQARDASGALVSTRRGGPWFSPEDVTLQWDGRDDVGRALPAGTYQLSMRSVDLAGNPSESVPLGAVEVRDGVPTLTHETFTVTAEDSLYDARVGRCSTLRQPSRHRWAGSIGLYSQTRCRAGRAAARIKTYHRWKAPVALAYDEIRMSLVGGSARRDANACCSHLRWGVFAGTPREEGSFLSVEDAKSPIGVHRSGSSYTGDLVLTSRGYLRWGTALPARQRYDVRSFRVELTYWVVS